MQIRIKDGKVRASLSKREQDALSLSLTVLQFMARNDLFSVDVYKSVMKELEARKVTVGDAKQGTLGLETEEADEPAVKA